VNDSAPGVEGGRKGTKKKRRRKVVEARGRTRKSKKETRFGDPRPTKNEPHEKKINRGERVKLRKKAALKVTLMAKTKGRRKRKGRGTAGLDGELSRSGKKSGETESHGEKKKVLDFYLRIEGRKEEWRKEKRKRARARRKETSGSNHSGWRGQAKTEDARGGRHVVQIEKRQRSRSKQFQENRKNRDAVASAE